MVVVGVSYQEISLYFFYIYINLLPSWDVMYNLVCWLVLGGKKKRTTYE